MPRRSWPLLVLFAGSVIALGSVNVSGQPPKKNEQKKAPPKVEPKKVEPRPPEPKLPDPKAVEEIPQFDATRPTHPLDLVRGLRFGDQADLALQYVERLEGQPLPADVVAVLPLEKALCRLAMAEREADDAKRESQVARARGEFDLFLASASSHPRRIEAELAVAQATSLQARIVLSRALKQPRTGDKDKAEALRAVPLFQQASELYRKTARKLDDLLKGGSVDGYRKLLLTRELHQAQLDAGINLVELSRAYLRPSGAAEINPRNEALKDARSAFANVAERDVNNPFTWSARAWAAECEYLRGNIADGDKQNADIRSQGVRYPAGREGIRMSRFFEVARKYIEANTATLMATARSLGERWLADYGSPRPSREQFAVEYYVAVLRKDEAIATGVRYRKSDDGSPEKSGRIRIESVTGTAQQMLRTAEREFRRLIERECDYSERAAKERTQVVRILIGDPLKPPAAYRTFEEAQMAALVSFAEALQNPNLTPAERRTKAGETSHYLERALALAAPTDSARDIAEARVQLAYAYLQAQEPQKAAVLGEHLSRSLRAPALAARAGVIAVQGYLSSAPAAGMDVDDEARQAAISVDQSKALALAADLEKNFPNETATDAVRFLLGRTLYSSGKYAESFHALSRITPAFTAAADARLLEGAAAFQVLKAETRTPLAARDRKAVYDRAVSDLKAVTVPSSSATVADARSYLNCRQQLIELYLIDQPPAWKAAERAAGDLRADIDTFRNLTDDQKLIHRFHAERLRGMAVAVQASAIYNRGQWKELSEFLEPVLRTLSRDVESAGPAIQSAKGAIEGLKKEGNDATAAELTRAAEELDRFRRDRIILVALQGRIRAGETGKTGELIGLMEKLGGSIDAYAGTLNQLLGVVRPQAAALRKDGKSSEAERLTKGVGDLVLTFAERKDLPLKYIYFAGKSLNDLELPAKAVELLKKIPDATDADLKARFNDLPEDRKNAVRQHRSAKLELARAHRLLSQFDDAEQVLAAALGTDEKPGWAAKALDYRKENVYLLEARAAAETDPKKLTELWTRANQGWGRIGRDYVAILTTPLPKDPEKRNEAVRTRETIKPIYYGILCENQRCLVKANTAILNGKPDALARQMDKIAANLRTVETQNPDLAPEVREKFAELLDEFPDLRKRYIAAGGVLFVRGADGSLPPSVPPAP